MNQGIQIQPVTSPRDMMKFVKFPWKVNAADPYWVPPLIRDRMKMLNATKNPFFKHNPAQLFLAYDNGELVGRIAAIINYQHNQFHSDNIGFFGFLEAINNISVFKALLDKAEDWLRNYHCEKILGPVNPTTNDEIGFLVKGFDNPPYFMLSHNPPYYNENMEMLGYKKAKDFYSYLIEVASFELGDKIKRVKNLVLKRYPVTLRTGNIKNFKTELQIMHEIYNDAFANHWGFVPMTSEQSDFFSADLKLLIDPDLVLIAEYQNEPVGFLLALPNFNEVFKKIENGKLFPFGLFKLLLFKKKIKGVRVITLGIKKKFESLGLGSLFYEEIGKRIISKGYSHVEMSWVMEDNLSMNSVARQLGGKLYKTYRVYQKLL